MTATAMLALEDRAWQKQAREDKRAALLAQAARIEAYLPVLQARAEALEEELFETRDLIMDEEWAAIDLREAAARIKL